MINCKLCKWCFKPIEEDFIVTDDWDFVHENCYKEFLDVKVNDVFEGRGQVHLMGKAK